MNTMIIRQGHYYDTRDGQDYVLTGFTDKVITFNGNITITVEDFNKYFKMCLA